MDVQKAGITVTYGDLDPEKARAIVDQHLGRGVVVKEWVVTRGARTEPAEEEL